MLSCTLRTSVATALSGRPGLRLLESPSRGPLGPCRPWQSVLTPSLIPCPSCRLPKRLLCSRRQLRFLRARSAISGAIPGRLQLPGSIRTWLDAAGRAGTATGRASRHGQPQVHRHDLAPGHAEPRAGPARRAAPHAGRGVQRRAQPALPHEWHQRLQRTPVSPQP